MKLDAVRLEPSAYSILSNFTELDPLPRESLLNQSQFLSTVLIKSQLQRAPNSAILSGCDYD